MTSIIEKVKGYNQSFLCGDFNYDLLKSHLHQRTGDFLSDLMDKEYTPQILKPTRVTHKSSSLIDNIFVTFRSIKSSQSYIVTDCMSDHFPCILSYTLDNVKILKKPILIEKRKLTEDVILKIQQKLLFEDWNHLDDPSLLVNECYEYLLTRITKALDEVAPLKVIKINSDNKFREAWLTVSIKHCNQKCHKLCSSAKALSLEAGHIKYQTYRNVLNKIKQHEKRSHYKDLFQKLERIVNYSGT